MVKSTPCSLNVGTSGSWTERRSSPNAIGLRPPFCTKGSAATVEQKITCVVPVTVATVAGALPLKGMWIIFVPVTR